MRKLFIFPIVVLALIVSSCTKGDVMDDNQPPKEKEPKMVFTVEISKDHHSEETGADWQTFRIPFASKGQTGDYVLTVDWGDGSSMIVSDSSDLSMSLFRHKYAEEGRYTVTVTSSQTDFQQPQIPRIRAYPEGRRRDTESFADVSLISIDTPLLNTGSTSFFTGFMYYFSLQSIPADLFKYNVAVEDFSSVFAGCFSLQNIPGDLFKYNTAAKSFRTAFMTCKELKAIPSGLFHNNLEATDFESVFAGCEKAIVSRNIFCDEGNEKTTRFASLNDSINFAAAFWEVGSSLADVDLTDSNFPSLWEYTYGCPADKVDKSKCFDTAKAANAGDVDDEWK
ncbi:MAG: hypothetical protein ACRCY5_08335 [Phocaeicola sp.]